MYDARLLDVSSKYKKKRHKIKWRLWFTNSIETKTKTKKKEKRNKLLQAIEGTRDEN